MLFGENASDEKDFRIRSLASSFSDCKIRKARVNSNATSCIFFSGMMFVRRSHMVNKYINGSDN